jgi:hypothetical protein
MLTELEIGTLYEALAGFKNWSASRRVLRYDGTRFWWWPVGRSMPADQVVGVYDSRVSFSQLLADVRWAELNLNPAPHQPHSMLDKELAWKAA